MREGSSKNRSITNPKEKVRSLSWNLGGDALVSGGSSLRVFPLANSHLGQESYYGNF